MAKAKKLPSGSWRCLAYSHTERRYDEKTGTWKDKRIYESFTSDDHSMAGKREAEAAAALFQLNKEKTIPKRKPEFGNMTLHEAIDAYIDSRVPLKRSPTTIQDYRCIQKNAFRDIMDIKLKDLDGEILQEAINAEAQRTSRKRSSNPKPLSAKRLKNEWGLVSAVLIKYRKEIDLTEIELPQVTPRHVELPSAQEVLRIIKGTDIELPVLLAAWLSFSMSEVRGLTKSKSVNGDYITIREVVVDVDGQPVRKEMGKNPTRNRRHRIPPYIKQLIDKVDGDDLVPMSGRALYHRWIRLLDENGMAHITFHDLRHLNASVMALLRVPDKYAQERGGWKSDQVMKRVYMQTFSEGRENVDNMVDSYFEKIVEPEDGDIDRSKYQAWLLLFERDDNRESKKEFLRWMQHETQHELKKAT